MFLLQERELKLAADSVLCEVRKKQADVKRMQDILRSLEKLRKLRKEAASRKGGFQPGSLAPWQATQWSIEVAFSVAVSVKCTHPPSTGMKTDTD